MPKTQTAADFLKVTEDELARRMTKAGLYFVSKLRGYLNIGQPYRRTKKGNHIGLAPSWPGEFPRKLSGQLQRSMTWTYDRRTQTLTVGSNLKGYPGFLELGTKWMKPRPWLTLGFNKERGTMTKMIVEGG